MKYDLMKYDLVFGYFGWVGIDLDICFDVLGFSVTVCRFQNSVVNFPISDSLSVV